MSSKEWLKSLKKGDKVAVSSGYYRDNWHVETVDKITLTGRIVTVNCNNIKSTFNNSGYKGDGYSHSSLCPISQKMIDERRRQQLVREMKKIDFNELDLHQLKVVHNILANFKILKLEKHEDETV